MPIRVGRSTRPTVDGAAADLRAQLGDAANALVIYFASAAYSQTNLAAALHGQLDGAHTIGCSTSGQIIRGVASTESVVAMALAPGDSGDVAVALVDDLHDSRALDRAILELERQLGLSIRDLDGERAVGLVLMAGVSAGEKSFVHALGKRTGLRFVGGSAGDDLAFAETCVTADGRARSRGAVLAILHPPRGFEVVRTRNFVELRGLGDACGPSAHPPTIGFSTCGEAGVGHMNQTSTMLLRN